MTIVNGIERHERPTIMDGQVVTFSTAFEKSDGIFGDSYKAVGCFEVSASRDAVMVHHATLRSDDDVRLFEEALSQASCTFLQLSGGAQ